MRFIPNKIINRFALSLFLFITVPGMLQAGAESLQEARLRWLKGNYGEARVLYEKAAKDPAQKVKAAIGISRCWRSVGEYEKAMEVLQAALKDNGKNADLLAEQADLYYFHGELDKAYEAAGNAIDQKEEQFLAHWVLARVLTDQGKFFTAGKELLWFTRIYNKRSQQGKEITDPDELLLIGLATAERARRDARLNDQFQFVLSEVWGFALKKDNNYWPARYYRGEVFLEKYDQEEAFKEHNKALVINPQAAEVYASKGLNALHSYQIADAEVYCDQALKINPRLPEGLRLKADIYLTAGDTAKAMGFLAKALKVNPRSEETLARVAACHYLDRKKEKLDEVIKQVEKLNPKPGEFYFALGKRLDEGKHYYDAEKYFTHALKLRPDLAKASNELGLLYMRLGKEQEAKKLLAAASKADPFHVRVYNSLKVLNHLEKYDTLKTAHFELRYDSKNDKILAGIMAKYLEEIYEELATQFQYRPKGPILIEVFNNHSMFSGRVVALPDLHTIGACTGKMVAMVSPYDQAKVVDKPFNWNRVLRHELVHIFNLEQTNFLVPHWFTEGLAVVSENMPMPPRWYSLLKDRVQSGELMNLDDIHLGFIRPGTSDNWQMAYLQSKLYVEYLTKTHGQKAIGGLLDAYREGMNTGDAIAKVCKVSKEEFEKGYKQHLQDLVKSFAGAALQKEKSFSELKDLIAKKPDDPAIAAALAEEYLKLNNKDQARTLADKALSKQDNQPQACYVKAMLALSQKDQAGAKTLLQKALTGTPPHLDGIKLLGMLQFEAKNFAEAARVFEQGQKVQPYENYWLAQLVRCYKQANDTPKLIDALKMFAPTESDDLTSRRALAILLSKQGNHAEAENYALQALEIDVLDVDARQVLLDSLKAQNKQKELGEWQKLLEEK